MERRASRVSERQWTILLEFLERNPNLARARGYNNSARGRAQSLRLWQEVGNLLNAEGSGTTKTPKDWSIYVSNYKSKLKKVVADINADASGTGGGPPRGATLSETDNRFLALMGPGFGQTAPRDPQPSTSAMPQAAQEDDIPYYVDVEIVETAETPPLIVVGADSPPLESPPLGQADAEVPLAPVGAIAPAVPPGGAVAPPTLPRTTRRIRQRSRPLAPLDEARRILSQVEMQRAAADAAIAEALTMIAENIGRVANTLERYLQ